MRPGHVSASVGLVSASATALWLVSMLGCDPHPASGVSLAPTANPTTVHAGERLEPAASAPKTSSVACSLDTAYPGMWSLPEASAAAEIEPTPGTRAILAISDSGNHGDAMLWTLPSGPLTPLRLDLDPNASDDVEGAAWTGGHLFTLTSSGAVRRYTPSATGALVRDRAAYPIGPRPYVCGDLHDGNCGKNYEGLCLRRSSKVSRCAGFAASKTEGALYCVVFHGDALVIDPLKPPIRLDVPKKALSDCAFGSAGGPAEDTLLVTTNIYGGSTNYIVDEGSGALEALDVSSLPNNEAIAVDRDGALYQFMDGDTSVSPSYRATCHGWTKVP